MILIIPRESLLSPGNLGGVADRCKGGHAAEHARILEVGNQGPVPSHGMPGHTRSRGVHREQAGDEARQLLRHVIIHPRF